MSGLEQSIPRLAVMESEEIALNKCDLIEDWPNWRCRSAGPARKFRFRGSKMKSLFSGSRDLLLHRLTASENPCHSTSKGSKHDRDPLLRLRRENARQGDSGNKHRSRTVDDRVIATCARGRYRGLRALSFALRHAGRSTGVVGKLSRPAAQFDSCLDGVWRNQRQRRR
jgi:hypothetical protein